MLQRVMIAAALFVVLGCAGEPAHSPAGESSQSSFLIDVVYGHEYGLALTLDVYVPSEPNGAGVVLTNSAGGKSPLDVFKVKDLEGYRFSTDEEMTASDSWHVLSPRRMVEAGFTVFEVRHGSEPKFEMPEIVDHVRQAVRFVKRNAGEHGVDPERIGLWGGSASGHLSLLVGTSPEVPLRDTANAFANDSAVVQAVVVFAAPADLAMFVRDNPKEREDRPVMRLTDEQYLEYSPTTYVTADDPPTLIMHGNADTDVPIAQGRGMFAALQQAGVESAFVEFESTTHSPTVEEADRGVTAAISWFEEHLLGRKQ